VSNLTKQKIFAHLVRDTENFFDINPVCVCVCVKSLETNMRCRIITKLGIDVTQPDNYHEYDEHRSLSRAILWSVSVETSTPQSQCASDVVVNQLPDGVKQLPSFVDDAEDVAVDQSEEYDNVRHDEGGDDKEDTKESVHHHCERHELCAVPFQLHKSAETVELEIDPVVAIIARPEFKDSAYNETSLQHTFVHLCHDVDPVTTPRLYLLVSKPSSTLDVERVSAIVPDHKVAMEAVAKLRTQPLYLALHGFVKEHLTEIDPVIQIVCDYCVSCTCTFDALVRRDAEAGMGVPSSVFECTFPQPYTFGDPLFVRIFGRIAYHDGETLLLKRVGGARCGADGCACYNLRDEIEDAASQTLSSVSECLPKRDSQLDSQIPIPVETAASVVFWCDEVHSLEQQTLRCRRLLLATTTRSTKSTSVS
jgi:hypothetical protein